MKIILNAGIRQDLSSRIY